MDGDGDRDEDRDGDEDVDGDRGRDWDGDGEEEGTGMVTGGWGRGRRAETAQDSTTLARLFLAWRRPSLLRNDVKSTIYRASRSNRMIVELSRARNGILCSCALNSSNVDNAYQHVGNTCRWPLCRFGDGFSRRPRDHHFRMKSRREEPVVADSRQVRHLT